MGAARPSWLDHFRPFFRGLCLRPVLVSPVVFVLAVAWFRVGADYGIPDQFWHEDLFKQYLAGVGTALLLVQICLVAYLLDAESPWLENRPVPGPEPRECRVDYQMRWYLARSWLPLMILVALAAVLNVQVRWPLLLGQATPLAGLLAVALLRTRRLATSRVTLIRQSPSLLWLELSLHTILATAGVALIGFVIPNRELEWLCFALSWWLAGHAALLFAFRQWNMPDEDRRRMHRRAGLAFGGFFLIYQALFILFWLDGGQRLAPWVAPPALVFCLLAALVATVHGFLEYHFRRWYLLVVLALLVVIGLVTGRPRYKMHFPGLSYEPADRVQLLEADFEGQLAQLHRRHADLKADPDNAAKRQQVVDSYEALARSCRRLGQRFGWRLKLMGRTEPASWPGQALPDGKALAAVLEAGKFDIAEGYYRRWEKTHAHLHGRFERLEVEALEEWARLACAPGKSKPKLVVVAVSGGANRSALWTTLVLDQLERAFADSPVPFARSLRLITGASGGMVGASYWVATLNEKTHRHPEAGRDDFIDRVAADSLTLLGQHALFLDLPTLLLPGEFDSDRGVALERAWAANQNGALNRSFRSLARGEAEGWRPSLIVSPMLVEDGRRLLISNLYLPFLTESAGELLSGTDLEAPTTTKPKGARRPRPTGRVIKPDGARFSLSAVEFFQLFPDADRFPLSTAARMSATFPYFSPAVDLPTTPRRRVVDAGYYDNYGVNVAADWIYHYRHWLAEKTSGVVLIQLRDSSSEQRRLFPDDDPAFWDYARALEWLTGPLVGAGSAREAGMSFRNDELVQVLSDFFNTAKRQQFFTTVVFESQEDIALSWFMTRRDIARMKTGFEGDGAGPNRRALDQIKRWWKEDHSAR